MTAQRLLPASLALVLAGCGVFGIGSSSDAPKPTPLAPITATVNSPSRTTRKLYN